MEQDRYDSPMGSLVIVGNKTALTALYFADAREIQRDGAERPSHTVLRQTKEWLDQYFSGKVPSILPPMAPHGTPFETAVWALLSEIPYGQTVSYGALARDFERRCGRKTSARAIGRAVGRNPIAILVPCHRVVGADGALTGYAWGIERKRALLQLENVSNI